MTFRPCDKSIILTTWLYGTTESGIDRFQAARVSIRQVPGYNTVKRQSVQDDPSESTPRTDGWVFIGHSGGL